MLYSSLHTSYHIIINDTKVNLVVITLHTRTIKNTVFFSFFAKQEILRDKPAFSHHPTHS